MIHTNKGDITLKLFPDEVGGSLVGAGGKASPTRRPASCQYPDEARGWGCLGGSRAEPGCGWACRPLVSCGPTGTCDVAYRTLPALPPPQCPRTVENFTTHAKNGYYDGIIFHR